MGNRRNALVLGAGALLALGTTRLMATDFDSADPWMQDWIKRAIVEDKNARKGVKGALHVGRFADPVYYLLSTIGWNPEGGAIGRYQPVRVPVGFVTDFASIPRVFWSVLPPDGLYSYAAIIHDYLYWEQYLSREDSDEIFRLTMIEFKIPTIQVEAIYLAVRAGGAAAWNENAKLKKTGEKRRLKTLPDDPRVRWSDWKFLDVFA